MEKVLEILNRPVDPQTGVYIIFGTIFVTVLAIVIMAEWPPKRPKTPHHSKSEK